MTNRPLTVAPAELGVLAFTDPQVERRGFGPTDPYIDWCVTPIVGCSGVAMWRRLCWYAGQTDRSPLVIDTAELFASLGLSRSLCRNSAGARTLNRLVMFDLAFRDGHNGAVVAVRRALPRLSWAQAERLPLVSRRYHEERS